MWGRMKGVSKFYKVVAVLSIFLGSIFVLGALYVWSDMGDWQLALGFLFLALWGFWNARRIMK